MKKNIYWIIAVCMFASSTSGAAISDSVSASIGAKFRSNLVRRGATIYDSWQLSPIIYVGFFEDRIQFLGSSLEFRDYVIPNRLRLRTKINRVTDDPFFEKGLAKNSDPRLKSWEWTSTAEWFFEKVGELNFVVARDIRAHNGTYFELTPRIYLGSFFEENGKARVRPEIFAQIGWGDFNHNQYQYGRGAGHSGLNNLAYGFQISSPAKAETIYPVLQFYRYEILGTNNRAGSRVKDKIFGYHFMVLGALNLL